MPSAPDGNSDEADAKNPSMAMQAPQPARHEAKSDEKVSISDKWIIGLTAVIAFTSIVAAFIFGKQLTAMQGQLDAMAFSERPWLSLDVRPSGPLLHNDKGWSFGISWYLPLSYRVKNLGKTPATDVAFFAHIVPVVTGEGGIFIPEELDRACTFWQKMQQAGIGITELVFPQEEWPEKQFTVHGREEDFEAAKSADGMKAKYLGQFLVTACVIYRPSFPVETSYRTAKEYYVGSRVGSIDLNSAGIESDNLAFGPNRTRGTLAR